MMNIIALRQNKVVAGVIYAAVGVLMLAFPRAALYGVSMIAGVLMVLIGAYVLLRNLYHAEVGVQTYVGTVGGAFAALTGLFVIIYCDAYIEGVAFAIELVLIISAIIDMEQALRLRNLRETAVRGHQEPVWRYVALAAAVIVLVVVSWGLGSTWKAITLIGITLVYYGVANLLMVYWLTEAAAMQSDLIGAYCKSHPEQTACEKENGLTLQGVLDGIRRAFSFDIDDDDDDEDDETDTYKESGDDSGVTPVETPAETVSSADTQDASAEETEEIAVEANAEVPTVEAAAELLAAETAAEEASSEVSGTEAGTPADETAEPDDATGAAVVSEFNAAESDER